MIFIGSYLVFAAFVLGLCFQEHSEGVRWTRDNPRLTDIDVSNGWPREDGSDEDWRDLR